MKNLELLSKIALSFQNTDNFEQQVKDILKEVGEHINVSKVALYTNKNENVLNNIFEWCNKGSTSKIDTIENIETKNLTSWNEIIKEEGYICSDNIEELPQDIREVLEMQNIKSLIVYPIYLGGHIGGFISFDESRYKRKWKKEELEILSTISGIIGNACERRKYQKKIISSENNFRNFFETIDDMLIISDLNGDIIYTNPAVVEKTEYSYKELKKMNLVQLNPENQREKAKKIGQGDLKEHKKYYYLTVESKSKKLYPIETKSWVGKWNNKECIYNIAKDLTQEKEKEELFIKVFKNNPLPMIITSKDQRILTKVNPSFLETTGYREDEVKNKSIDKLEIFENTEKIIKISKALRQGDKVKNKEVSFKGKDGKSIVGLYSGEKIISNGKESYLSVVVDVTDKAKMTKDLEIQCQKLTNIIEGTKLGTWEWDIETGDLLVNEQWAKMIGYKVGDLQKPRIQLWNRFAHPEDIKKSERLIEEHLEGKSDYYNFEIRMKHKDGRWIWIHDRGKVTERDSEGKPLKMFGTHSEITKRKEAEQALKENEKRFFLALDKTKLGLWDYDMISETVFLSSMWKEILGYKNEEIKNSYQSWRNLWHPEDRALIEKSQQDYLSGKSKDYEVIHRLKHKDGNWRWILTRGGILKNEEGNLSRWIGTNADITVEYEQSLELENMFSVNLDLLCIVDMEGDFIKTNKVWNDVLGYSKQDLVGHSILKFVHKDDMEITEKTFNMLKSNKKVDYFTNRNRTADGGYRYLEWRANPYKGSVYAAARDVTERIEYENKILEISNRDALTNVYNRRYVYERAEEIIEKYKEDDRAFSVSILDIDHFKKINDNYGHQVGDEVLKAFTDLIGDNIRKEDILGRYGGEEFIVILNNVNENENNNIIQRILDIVREKIFYFNGHEINFTFSAGISSSREIGKDEIIIDKLIELADKRMYQAKNAGRNKIVC